jgi:hypothetical protein
MASKENHKRFRITRELSNLVGKAVIVNEFGDCSPVSHHVGFLIFNNGYYVNNNQIPVRAITGIYDECEIAVDSHYMADFNKKMKKQMPKGEIA